MSLGTSFVPSRNPGPRRALSIYRAFHFPYVANMAYPHTILHLYASGSPQSPCFHSRPHLSTATFKGFTTPAAAAAGTAPLLLLGPCWTAAPPPPDAAAAGSFSLSCSGHASMNVSKALVRGLLTHSGSPKPSRRLNKSTSGYEHLPFSFAQDCHRNLEEHNLAKQSGHQSL